MTTLFMNRVSKFIPPADDYVGNQSAQYRAVWIAEDGEKSYGYLTDKASAFAQMALVSKYRTSAWVEDEKGNKVTE